MGSMHLLDKRKEMKYIKRKIILINEQTGERKDFASINAAARFLDSTFANVQMQAVRNSTLRGWRVYEDAETIRQHIKALKEQLKIVEQ